VYAELTIVVDADTRRYRQLAPVNCIFNIKCPIGPFLIDISGSGVGSRILRPFRAGGDQAVICLPAVLQLYTLGSGMESVCPIILRIIIEIPEESRSLRILSKMIGYAVIIIQTVNNFIGS
jgi:hypothetical protein